MMMKILGIFDVVKLLYFGSFDKLQFGKLIFDRVELLIFKEDSFGLEKMQFVELVFNYDVKESSGIFLK